jgi:hypothetical protein
MDRNFQGVLRVTGSVDFSMIGLRARYNERGDFLIATLPPALTGSVQTGGIFPHIVDGGGYSTQIIIVGEAFTEPWSGEINFISKPVKGFRCRCGSCEGIQRPPYL